MLLRHFLLSFKRRNAKKVLVEGKEYEHQDLLAKIEKIYPTFDEKEILAFIKKTIPMIHYCASYNQIDRFKKYGSENLLGKMLNSKNVYRISEDIDNVSVGYARLQDIQNEKKCIKVYVSVFFYDEVANNVNQIENDYDKYWNDIWIVSLIENKKRNKEAINKCPACGAYMDFNYEKHMFSCSYCRNSLYYSQVDWKVIDIEVKPIEYKL